MMLKCDDCGSTFPSEKVVLGHGGEWDEEWCLCPYCRGDNLELVKGGKTDDD